ncbi:amidase domain-containing protein [Clostridium sp. CX1]|uniref:amidase domain-containing protein n=1 Tax=Clostridium sp. CX1 TaxID=2978346 RepID=UPI0021BE062C|nr:amidase domain-containing protein [Clostridium sp. CX1]MCT8975456.1 amidase domain-containing protein [Clostridium sp. CX1]
MYIFRQSNYSRTAAVNYAVTYALKPNPAYRYFPLINDTSGDCANFVSQCLRAGGAPMNFTSRSPWWYRSNSNNNVKDDTWSISWAVAHSLYWTLKINEQSGLQGPKGREVSSIGELELGDLMFFEDNNGKIFHSAIVTGFSNKVPLISHHSFEALNIPYTRTWGAKKIHFLKITI